MKQICEYQADQWQPKQPPPLKSNISQKNKSPDNGADQKGIMSEQRDISAIQRCMGKQVTRADLAAQNIRDEWRN
jgi:hypothetical protein